MSSFTRKDLRVTFILSGGGTFEGSVNNTLMLEGLRVSARVVGSGLPAFPEATIMVYGMKQSDMNRLTALQFQPLALQRNTVILEANSGAGWSVVFSGQIITAGPDYSGAPEVPLRICARLLGFESLDPATPTSYSGTVSAATAVSAVASKMGYAFENNGVDVQLDRPYFPNTSVEQLRAICAQAGIDCYTEANTIAICPRGVPRRLPRWVLSPSSGLVGYPTLDYNRGFVQVTALFNPAFRFGGPVRIENSDIPTANGDWLIGTLAHTLESRVLGGGAWFSELLCYPPGSVVPLS